MTKKELSIEISKRMNCHVNTAEAFIESFMYEVKIALHKGKSVDLRGFGTFKIKHQAEKKARNIKAGTTIVIPARNKPHFTPSERFKKQLNQNAN